jgi:signal transduction histidine kinase/DNA-binding response OmpR family regulator
MEDSQQRLWIGTFSSGMDRFDRASNKFVHYKPTGYHSVHCAYVCDLVEAKNGDIWIATSSGLDVLEKKTGDFSRHYFHNNAEPLTSLSNDNTIAITEDSRGLIWVTTREGLDYYDPVNRVFTTLRKEDGLPDNIIVSIVEDRQHNLWVGTPNGLCHIIVDKDKQSGKLTFQFRNYNEPDGLQGREFNEYAAYATREGELIFGGANGFNMFMPQEISNVYYDPLLVITDLQMFNKSIGVGEKLNGHVILPQSIYETKQITLKYDENVFAIEFAALNFFSTSKLHYAYALEGFNNEWFIADDKTHKATYTNLDPGDYTFKVRTINENGTWSKEGVFLKIKILPPFWRTPFAYVSYVLLFAASLYVARRMVLKRARAKFALEQERMEAQRLHDLDMMKIRFFTNVSHDFRTPLSLIITPLDKIIKNASEPAQKHQFQMIHRNARRLLNLVNQLLDFRKMEMQELKLNLAKGDIIHFIKNISYSFTDLAEKKNITFSYNSSIARFVTQFDHDKIERILFNLLSNAFKFTPGNGSVSVELSGKDIDDGKLLEIKVKDTGIGIPPEKHEKIFERFFQNDMPGNIVSQGSGIGLAITKEFVKLHNGSITVESETNKGSCFCLLLSLKSVESLSAEFTPDSDERAIDMAPLYDELNSNNEQTPIDANAKSKDKVAKKPSVLIVEDNDDLRFYLKDNLKQYFSITEAANGKAGWQKALASHPDLIVSDINMPDMNGIELCRKIKGDKRTSFVPVILLTALTGEEQQLKGLETGASDYITKPFNFEILLSKIRNLLAQQETVKRTYQKHVNAGPSEIHIESAEEKFVQQVLEVIEKNIANPDFSVEELSRELYMSRVALYKKMLALTFKTPIEFIRSIRLQRAAQLLEKSKLTIAEIAYEVGFNDPKYFSRFFKAEFNMLPSTYQAEKRKELSITNAAENEDNSQMEQN